MTENTPSDALVEAMARAIYEADDPWHVAWPWPDLQSDQAGVDHYRRCAEAAAAVVQAGLDDRVSTSNPVDDSETGNTSGKPDIEAAVKSDTAPVSDKLREAMARAMCSADGLDYHEVCGREADPDLDECDSGTCPAAYWEEHDAEDARALYRRYAQAAAAVIASHMARKDAELAELRAEIEALRGALEEIANLPGEINPSNYDHDDACELNRQFCYGGSIARAALGSAGDE